ncbi:hypothetical protein TNCT_192731 [Trichonephila clavata]|uniref:Uncharacterized protein n=1 Tax=Trichonephila clavata TaxID=2740835 RepID=A0A8X6H0J3_TRICU|nr:hypothetical protein TNCT_192731 [Trichonephila clavata]
MHVSAWTISDSPYLTLEYSSAYQTLEVQGDDTDLQNLNNPLRIIKYDGTESHTENGIFLTRATMEEITHNLVGLRSARWSGE